MAERHGSGWWPKVPERIQKTVKTRMEEDAKFRWHGARGITEINYCDFGDLSSIIITNWEVFEDVVANLEWAKAVLGTLEKSRNIVMHGGVLVKEDLERVVFRAVVNERAAVLMDHVAEKSVSSYLS